MATRILQWHLFKKKAFNKRAERSYFRSTNVHLVIQSVTLVGLFIKKKAYSEHKMLQMRFYASPTGTLTLRATLIVFLIGYLQFVGSLTADVPKFSKNNFYNMRVREQDSHKDTQMKGK